MIIIKENQKKSISPRFHINVKQILGSTRTDSKDYELKKEVKLETKEENLLLFHEVAVMAIYT